MKRNPWLKFWAQDWLTDIELRSCSSAQRGTLIDLMCIAHRNENYGVILDNDTPEARKMLAKCLSLTERTLNNHLTSLLQMSRICRTDDGQLFIKRMVQDFHKSLTYSENGKKGGNPLLNQTVKAEENREEEKRIDDKVDYAKFVDWWNRVARSGGLPTIKRLTPQRKEKIRIRMDEGFADLMDDIADQVPHLYENAVDWMNVDFLLKNETNGVKVSEGNYRAKDGQKKVKDHI